MIHSVRALIFPVSQKPLKWTDYLVASFPEYNTTGAVTLVFQVYNVREPIVFSLFSGGTAAPVVIAQSVPATFADPGEPLVRLSVLLAFETTVRAHMRLFSLST